MNCRSQKKNMPKFSEKNYKLFLLITDIREIYTKSFTEKITNCSRASQITTSSPGRLPLQRPSMARRVGTHRSRIHGRCGYPLPIYLTLGVTGLCDRMHRTSPVTDPRRGQGGWCDRTLARGVTGRALALFTSWHSAQRAT